MTGLVAALGSSVAAYRVVGPYGDGPLNVGLYRTDDPETGAHLIYRDMPNDDGTVMRYLFNENSWTPIEIQVLRRVDGKLQTVGLRLGKGGVTRVEADGQTLERDAAIGGTKSGFSLRGNGIIDAWEFRDAKGDLVKIEVSRHQDGVVDRWEFYKDDQLARVELDENRDGRVDHWQTYEAGILISESWDRDGDGRPDSGKL